MKWNLTPPKFQNFHFLGTSLRRCPGGRMGERKWRKNIHNRIPCSIIFFSVFGSCVCLLGVVDIWSDKYISLYNPDAFLHSECVFCLCAWLSLLQNQPAVQRADIESWEHDGESSDADAGMLRGIASGSKRLFQRILLPGGNLRLNPHLNNVKLGVVVTWYPCSWSIATEVCQS